MQTGATGTGKLRIILYIPLLEFDVQLKKVGAGGREGGMDGRFDVCMYVCMYVGFRTRTDNLNDVFFCERD